MTINTFLITCNAQTLLLFLGVVLCFIRYKVKQHIIILLGFSLMASVGANLIYDVLRKFTNPNYGGSVYNIIVFPIIALIYFNALGKKNANVFIGLTLFYTVFGAINLMFIQKASINSYTLAIQSIIIILFALYYFYWLMRELPTSQLHRLPMFWINSAYMIYFSGNLFLFVFTSYLVKVLNNNLLVYWTMHNVFGIIEALMIIVALCLDLSEIKLKYPHAFNLR